ncbi:hypothetical protein [Rummeliibacillus sp. TYF-LIM-RU47]|uniref:hypothetical protein n=1 Tax=Rummeliibacillus sp. TYF-LIM-RU47 TaxID=2608406 RepID=UPI00123A5311|nr:hypothetical protein [Rummeliibacillus sp. TYF-LIM-RU47]
MSEKNRASNANKVGLGSEEMKIYYYEQSHTLIFDEGTKYRTVELPSTVGADAVKDIIDVIKRDRERADDG